jgi:hypothetical protein
MIKITKLPPGEAYDGGAHRLPSRTASLRTAVSVARKLNFARRETKAPKRDRKPQDIIAETKPQANNPANPALVGDNHEISVSLRVCGGPGRSTTELTYQ